MGVRFWAVIFSLWIDKRLCIGSKFWDALFGFAASHFFRFDVITQACHPEGAFFATEGSPGQSEEILRRWKNTSGSHRPGVLPGE